MRISRRGAIAGTLGALIAPRALSQTGDWPAKPPTWITPFAAGGGADAVSRLFANEIAKRFGQQIVVENKPGASGLIGTRQIAAAPPDGYTVGMLSDIHSVHVAQGQQLGYDAEKDFTYFSQLIRVPVGLYTSAKRPHLRSLAELIKFAKDNPGKLTGASIGPQTTHHLAMDWLRVTAGIEMVIVPFRGIPDGVQALITGDADIMFMGSSVAADGYIAKGMIHQVGVATRERLRTSASVPTLIEQGFPDFEVISWYGLVGPAGIPDPIAKRWHGDLVTAMQSPEARAKLEATGVEIATGTPAECAALVRTTTEKYKRIVALAKAGPKPR